MNDLGVRVACGKRENITAAIENGTIPKNCIIITKDDPDSELLFNDINGNLRIISERKRFESLTDAKLWAEKYPCKGYIFSVHNGSDWLPYIVSDENTLLPIPINGHDLSLITEINRIDGGTAAGI